MGRFPEAPRRCDQAIGAGAIRGSSGRGRCHDAREYPLLRGYRSRSTDPFSGRGARYRVGDTGSVAHDAGNSLPRSRMMEDLVNVEYALTPQLSVTPKK